MQHHAVGDGNEHYRKHDEDPCFDALECPEPTRRLEGDPLMEPVGSQASRGDTRPAEWADPARGRYLVEADPVAVAVAIRSHEATGENPRSGRCAAAF